VRGGTLDLTTSTDPQVEGTFDAAAESITVDSSGSAARDLISITGSSTAEDVETWVNTSTNF